MSLTDDSTKDNNKSYCCVNLATSARSLDMEGGYMMSEDFSEQVHQNIPDITEEDCYFIEITIPKTGYKRRVPIVDTDNIRAGIMDELSRVLDACLVNEKQKKAVYTLCDEQVDKVIDEEISRVLFENEK